MTMPLPILMETVLVSTPDCVRLLELSSSGPDSIYSSETTALLYLAAECKGGEHGQAVWLQRRAEGSTILLLQAASGVG